MTRHENRRQEQKSNGRPPQLNVTFDLTTLDRLRAHCAKHKLYVNRYIVNAVLDRFEKEGVE